MSRAARSIASAALALGLGLAPACGEGEPAPAVAAAPVPASTGADPAGAEPVLACGEPLVDLGRVHAGARLEHVFAVRSAGERDAVVAKLKPGCACSLSEAFTEGPDGSRVPYAEYDPIPPGRTLFVRVAVDTTGKQGPQSIPLSLYEAPQGKLVLTLLVEVEPWLVVEPAQILLGRRLRGERSSAETRVRGPAGERFRLECATAPLPDGLEVACTPLEPDAEGRSAEWAVRVDSGPSGEPGLVRAWLELRSDRAHAAARVPGVLGGPDPVHSARLMAVGEVLAAVSASVPELAFGHLRPGVLAARTVRIGSHEPGFALDSEPEVRLLGLDGREHLAAGRFSIVMRRVEGLPAFDLELSTEGLGEGFEGAFRGLLVVEIGHPEVFAIEVPFSGVQL